MTFRLVQCEMSGDEVSCRIVVADQISTTAEAEAMAASASTRFPEAGHIREHGYWWGREPNGRTFRFYVEVSDFDETDGT